MFYKSYFLYALEDPRTSPTVPFYIGKGMGAISYDHLVHPDDSLKGQRIREIIASGYKVLLTHLVGSLSENQALEIEADLISAFGMVETGGLLTNTGVPSFLRGESRPSLTVPYGTKEKAQQGLSFLKEAVMEFAKANPRGITNSEAAALFGRRSSYDGYWKDNLFFSILGLLVREGKLKRRVNSRRHVAQD
jgi:uncharacterized protein